MFGFVLRYVNVGCASVLSLVMLVLSMITGSLSETPSSVLPTPAFVIAEGNAPVLFGADPAECRPGQHLDRYGWLFDTSAFNLFTVYTFDGERALLAQFSLTERLRQAPHTGAWVQLSGQCVTARYLTASSYEPVPAIDDAVAVVTAAACAWVDAHRTTFDFNAYKSTQRFQQALASLYATLDLNAIPFEPAAEIVFIDAEQMIAGIDCGHYVLGETVQRGDYLTLLAIVDLDERRLHQVIVQNTGFFLE